MNILNLTQNNNKGLTLAFDDVGIKQMVQEPVAQHRPTCEVTIKWMLNGDGDDDDGDANKSSGCVASWPG